MLNEFIDALRAVVAAEWPETLPKNGGGGIWDDPDIRAIAFIRATEPYAVIEIPPMSTGEWGMDCNTLEGAVTFHYITQQGVDYEVLRGKLDSLKLALLDADLPIGQILDVETPDWSRYNEANQYFIEKNLNNVAGSITAHCIVQELVTDLD